MEHSGFHKISAEIRNQIYELVLVHEKPFMVTEDDCESDSHSTSSSPDSHPIALLHTCKQIKNEATALFYRSNKFCLTFTVGSGEDAQDQPAPVHEFCNQIGDIAFMSLRNLHVVAREHLWGLPTAMSADIHTKYLEGLTELSNFNSRLKIKYTAGKCSDPAHFSEVDKMEPTLAVNDLEMTLDAAIAKIANMDPSRAFAYFVRRDGMIEELRRVRKNLFGKY